MSTTQRVIGLTLFTAAAAAMMGSCGDDPSVDLIVNGGFDRPLEVGWVIE